MGMPPCEFCDECRADSSDYGGRIVCPGCAPRLFAGVAAAALEGGAAQRARDEALRQEGRQQALAEVVTYLRHRAEVYQRMHAGEVLDDEAWRIEAGKHLSKEGT